MFECVNTNNYFQSLANHITETTNNHIYFLIESVVSVYLKIRLHFIAKRESEILNPI